MRAVLPQVWLESSSRGGARTEVANQSLLAPIYTKLLWNPLVQRLPRGLNPNVLTWFGTACCFASFLSAVFLRSRPGFLLASALLFLYLTADNVDGAHARRTGKTSAYGEFLDHWLDTINFCFLTLGYSLGFGVESGTHLVCVGLALLCVALHFWEQRTTGHLFFSRVSDIEINTAIVLTYLLAGVFGTTFPGCKLPVLATLAGIPIAAALCLTRTRVSGVALLLLAGPIAGVIGWHLWGGLPTLPAYILMALLSPLLSGRIVLSVVQKNAAIHPNPLLAAGIVVAAVLLPMLHASVAVQQGAAWFLAVAAAALIVKDFVRGSRWSPVTSAR